MSTRRLYTETTTVPASSLLEFILLIVNEKRTGPLTINFINGKPDGTVKFEQHITLDPETIEKIKLDR